MDVASMETIVGTLFNEQELRRAVPSLQNNKPPGLDGISAEVVKITARVNPQMLLSIFNACLTEAVFSSRRKVAKLLLISKEKGADNIPSSYRHARFMLDTAGKMFELNYIFLLKQFKKFDQKGRECCKIIHTRNTEIIYLLIIVNVIGVKMG